MRYRVQTASGRSVVAIARVMFAPAAGAAARSAAGLAWIERHDPERGLSWPDPPLSRQVFEALEAAAVAASPRHGIACATAVAIAVAAHPDRETWPNGCDDFGFGRPPTEPRTLREYWAVFPNEGGELAVDGDPAECPPAAS